MRQSSFSTLDCGFLCKHLLFIQCEFFFQKKIRISSKIFLISHKASLGPREFPHTVVLTFIGYKQINEQTLRQAIFIYRNILKYGAEFNEYERSLNYLPIYSANPEIPIQILLNLQLRIDDSKFEPARR